MNVPSSVVTISPILVLMYVSIMSVKRTNGIIQSLKQQGGHGDYSAVAGFSSDCHNWKWKCSRLPGMIALTAFFIPKTVTVPVAIYDSVFFHALFIVHIYLCLQCLIPYSSSPAICYPVDANLHYVFNHCCVCSSFSGGLHASDQIWSQWRSPNVPLIWFTMYQDYMVTWMFVKFM